MLPKPEAPTIGRFRVRSVVHKGSPHVVAAFDPNTKRDVVLTLFPRSESAVAEQLDALIEPNKAALELRHPAIVPVLEIGVTDRSLFVARAEAKGKLLAEILAKGALAQRRAAVIARSLAEALALAHDRGFVHGEAHPDGVIVEGASAAWLDFGRAANVGPDKPAYAAPERLGDPPGEADAGSDQFGLGVLLFEMLTGQTPFIGDDEEIVADALMAETAPSLRAIDSAIDPKLEAICRKALKPAPESRYGSCQELADDLRRWLDAEPIQARPPGFVRRVLLRPAVLLPALALAIAGMAGLGAWAYAEQQAARKAADDARASETALASERGAKLGLADSRDKEAQAGQKVIGDLKSKEKDLAAARAEADKQRDAARRADATLKDEKAKLEKAKNDEAKARTDLEATLYCGLVRQSHRAWLDRDPERARAFLLSAKPATVAKPADKRPDFRGWEWHFLERLYRPPKTFTLKGDETQIAHVDPRSAAGLDLRSAAFAYSPDGGLLALCLLDDKVTMWNSLLGAKAAGWESHRNAICDVVFAADGQRVATASADKLVKVWQVADGRTEQTLRGHDDAVLCLAIRPDGKVMAGGGADRKIIIWDIESAEAKHTIDAHGGAVHGIAFDKSGATIASAGGDGLIKLWDANTAKLKSTLTGHAGAVHCVAFSPEGQQLASAGADRSVRLWDVVSGREIRALAGHSRSVRSVAFRHDGQRLVSAGDDRSVCIWDAAGALVISYPTGHTAPIHRVAFRSDGRQIATGSLDQTLKLWDAERPVASETRSLRGHDDAVTALAVSPDGKRLATGSADKTARLWDAATGEYQRSLAGHTGLIRTVVFSPDNALVVSGSDDGTARLWDAATGQIVRTVAGHTGAINAAAFSPDGKFLATAGADGAVRLRETATGQALYTFEGHRGGAIGVVFAPDGKRLLTTGADGSARFWNVESGEEIAGVLSRTDDLRLVGPTGALSRDAGAVAGGFPARAAYSPNGKRFACSLKNGSILLFETNLLIPTARMEGHDSPIRNMVFSPDNRRLVTCDGEGSVKVWDCRTGLATLSLAAHSGAVNGVAFSRDGRMLYTAGADRIVRIWDGAPDDPNVKPHDPDDDYGADPDQTEGGSGTVTQVEIDVFRSFRPIATWREP